MPEKEKLLTPLTCWLQLLTQSQRALSNIHTHLSSLDRNALPQFPKAEVRCNSYTQEMHISLTHGCQFHFGHLIPLQKSLREVQQILNSTEGNFHQLVALLNCRGLNKVT